MKISTILIAVSLCMPSADAEQSTLESLALKVAALERQIESLRADLHAAKRVEDGSAGGEKAPQRASGICGRGNRVEDGNADADKAPLPGLTIDILKDGRIQIEGKDLKEEELAIRIRPAMEKFPNQPIRIRADEEARYPDVIRVLDIFKGAGVRNVSFETGKPQDEQDSTSNGR